MAGYFFCSLAVASFLMNEKITYELMNHIDDAFPDMIHLKHATHHILFVLAAKEPASTGNAEK
jgi:hypothetical protein